MTIELTEVDKAEAKRLRKPALLRALADYLERGTA
jgi:hypothetical protein